MVNWAHRGIAVVLAALGVHPRGYRRRLSNPFDDLDWEIRRVRPAPSVGCSRADYDRLDVDALQSTDELRLLVDLYLRGWTSKEIKEKLDGTKSGGPRNL